MQCQRVILVLVLGMLAIVGAGCSRDHATPTGKEEKLALKRDRLKVGMSHDEVLRAFEVPLDAPSVRSGFATSLKDTDEAMVDLEWEEPDLTRGRTLKAFRVKK